jgi:hypothetical protein
LRKCRSQVRKSAGKSREMPRKPTKLPASRNDWTFGELVYYHLFIYGTRPTGDPNAKAGRIWEIESIAGALGLKTAKTIRNWIAGQNLPDSIEPLATALFGSNRAWDKARRDLVDKYEQAQAAKAAKSSVRTKKADGMPTERLPDIIPPAPEPPLPDGVSETVQAIRPPRVRVTTTGPPASDTVQSARPDEPRVPRSVMVVTYLVISVIFVAAAAYLEESVFWAVLIACVASAGTHLTLYGGSIAEVEGDVFVRVMFALRTKLSNLVERTVGGTDRPLPVDTGVVQRVNGVYFTWEAYLPYRPTLLQRYFTGRDAPNDLPRFVSVHGYAYAWTLVAAPELSWGFEQSNGTMKRGRIPFSDITRFEIGPYARWFEVAKDGLAPTYVIVVHTVDGRTECVAAHATDDPKLRDLCDAFNFEFANGEAAD